MPARHIRTIALVPIIALAAACSSNDDADGTAVAPEPVLTSNPVLTEGPGGSAIAPGEWLVEEDGDGARARFGTMDGAPRVTMECDRATQMLTLTQAGSAEGRQTYVLEADGQRARLDMDPVGGGVPVLSAQIDGTQPVFEGFATTGRVITITSADGEVLRIPTAPGISRVIDACS